MSFEVRCKGNKRLKTTLPGLKHGVSETSDCQSEGVKIWQHWNACKNSIPLDNGERKLKRICSNRQLSKSSQAGTQRWKLYRFFFCHGLKMCMCLFITLKIFFICFFRILNLVIFCALTLSKWESGYLVWATPLTVQFQPFWNSPSVLVIVWIWACAFSIIFLLFLCHIFSAFWTSFLCSCTINVYRRWVPCVRNSSYSSMPIFLKLYRCFRHGLKMCICFWYNYLLIHCYLFPILKLVIFALKYYQIPCKAGTLMTWAQLFNANDVVS